MYLYLQAKPKNWDSFATVSCKLVPVRLVFLKKNGHPLLTIKQLMKEIEESQKQKEVTQASIMEQPNPNPQEQKAHSLLLPFVGFKGTTINKNLNKTLKNVLPKQCKNKHYIHRSKIKQ